jgi:cell wall assembly regulator SMI1
MIADALRRLSGLRLKDEDGHDEIIELQPPATEAEIQALEGRLPCRIPDDIRDALRVSKGLANGPLESFSLVDLEGFGLEELLPYAYSIAHDGFGNYWVLDLLPGAPSWGPVFYVCHDPPVLAYQSPTIEAFLEDTVRMWQPGPRSHVDVVHEEVVSRIWRDNPDVMTPAVLQESGDPVLRAC